MALAVPLRESADVAAAGEELATPPAPQLARVPPRFVVVKEAKNFCLISIDFSL